MGAYNKVNGTYACENKHLLTDVLKNEWGFRGFVVTDWGAAHSTVKMANSGLDLEMPFPKYYGDKLLQAVQSGQVSEKVLNDKVSRILRAQFWAGLFDESVLDYGGHDDTPARRALALQAARESIVLLKNDRHFLPLKKDAFRKIAVIGPNGNVARMYGGGSGALNGNEAISPLEGIRQKVGNQVTVAFARGIPPKRTQLPIVGASFYRLPDGKPGVYAEYFNNKELKGQPVLTRVEKAIDFNWGYGGKRQPGTPGSPAPGVVNLDHWSARWTGLFRSPGEGWYDIGLKSDNGVRLYLNGEKILDAWTNRDAGKFKITRFHFRKNKWYKLRVDYYENVGSAQCKLGLAPYKARDYFNEAVALAKQSDLAVLCMGLNPRLESEDTDRDSLPLPARQERLIREVAQVNPNSLVVLYNATPILMNRWIDRVPAIVEAFYPGQEGGTALADILFGDVNPSGRLPITFPKRWADTPVHDTYPNPDVAVYKEGIFVGYRYYDKHRIEPLFPFGYGLSYTTFAYSQLHIQPAKISTKDTLTVCFDVTNTGKMAGDEVTQVYIHDVKAHLPREVKALKGLARVYLKPGERKTVCLKLSRLHLAYYDPSLKQWVAEPGRFEVWIGHSSRDIRLKGTFELKE
jgi:beta-glucosidase